MQHELTKYYLIISAPLLIIIWSLYKAPTLFVFLLLSYILFRIFYDRQRLIKKGLINKNDSIFKEMLALHIKYFKDLYLEK